MGNALRFLYRCCCEPVTSEQPVASSSASGVSALSRDLYHFETTSQVPDGLSAHVVSSKKAQANWYRKLLEAWKASNPPPRTPEEATRLVTQTLQRHKKADVEGLLTFYGLPLSLLPSNLAPVPTLPTGVLYEFHTLPVDAKAIPDGDTITVYVNTNDPRESSNVPKEVHVAAAHRSRARAERNYEVADDLHQRIIDAGYRVLNIHNEDILAKKYRIRLRGIDAPESAMEYGREAKEELVKLVQGKSIRVLVYGEDRYGRIVGDVYCGGTFVQEIMLKKGCAWHYIAYDHRPELAMWEKEARAKRIGLWAARNPMEPWQFRKNKRGAE